MRWKFLKNLEKKSTVVIVPVLKDGKKWPAGLSAEYFKGEKEEVLYSATGGVAYLFLGLGEKKKLNLVGVAAALSAAIKFLQEKKQGAVALQFDSAWTVLAKPQKWGETLARFFSVATYQFNHYKTDKERYLPAVTEIIFLNWPRQWQKGLAAGWEQGQIVAQYINEARDFGNHPASHMHPQQLADEAVRLAQDLSKLKVAVWDKKKIAAEKMNGLLAVNAGGAHAPVFIIMEYRGAAVKDAPVVLVGKGLTFDAGGISLKPADKMDEMKMDMLGGAIVIATVAAAARLKLLVNLVGLVPATENMPSGSAYRPGDILTMHSGKTVEVLNTDAEGRLILADALSYAKKFAPKLVIDLATLTGACAVALGESHAGLWANNEKLATRVQAAATESGDLVWRLPLGEDFSKQIKSEIADIKNTGERYGSANSSAAFLQEFTDYPWAHLDIAGVAWSQKLVPARRLGASGWGVALLIQLLKR